jgi:NIMA (never in mitosis gene a)-related kinase
MHFLESKYEVRRVLGQGGFGKASLVRDRRSGREYVLKEVRCPSERDLAAASQEARLLSSLEHPNIIKYIESQQQGKTLYIVMELANAGDLNKKLAVDHPGAARQPLSEDEIMDIFTQVVIALDYLHERRILHRDLKPANIFMMNNGVVKLGDFGIAKVLASADDLTNTIVGTPGFLSPEMYRRCKYGSKADIWALGCVLYTMCTLWPPFWPKGPGQDPSQLVLRGKYGPISTRYSEPLRRLVARLLSMDPNDRPSVRQILGMALLRPKLTLFQGRIADQNAVRNRPPTPPQPDKKPPEKKPRQREEGAGAQKEPNADPHWHYPRPQKPAPPPPQPQPAQPKRPSPSRPQKPAQPQQPGRPKRPTPPRERPELGRPPDKRPPPQPAVRPGGAWPWDNKPFSPRAPHPKKPAGEPKRLADQVKKPAREPKEPDEDPRRFADQIKKPAREPKWFADRRKELEGEKPPAAEQPVDLEGPEDGEIPWFLQSIRLPDASDIDDDIPAEPGWDDPWEPEMPSGLLPADVILRVDSP